MGTHLTATAAAARTLVNCYAGGDDSAAEALAALAVGTATALGPNAEDVAASCVAANMCGHPGDGADNPISRLLAAVLGATSVTVVHDTWMALTFIAADGEEYSTEGIELPEPVTDFLIGFTDGRWEHLVDRETRTIRNRFLRSVDQRMAGIETVTRGTVVSSVHRGGSSDPLSDAQVDAIAALGLAADDFADSSFSRLRLYRGDLAVGLVSGGDMRFVDYGGVVMPYDTEWTACAGFQFCPRPSIHTRFPSRDEALQWVLENLGQACHDRAGRD